MCECECASVSVRVWERARVSMRAEQNEEEQKGKKAREQREANTRRFFEFGAAHVRTHLTFGPFAIDCDCWIERQASKIE